MNARIFIDFWNFSINWRNRMNGAQSDWQQLPRVLVAQAEAILQSVSPETSFSLDETLVYASVKPKTDAALSHWLTNWLDSQPSFKVSVRERRV